MASTQTPAQKPAEQAQAPQKDQKATPALEEDDEFEDFPVEGRMVFKVEAHVLVASSSATLQCRVTRSGWISRRLGCSQNAYIAKMIRYLQQSLNSELTKALPSSASSVLKSFILVRLYWSQVHRFQSNHSHQNSPCHPYQCTAPNREANPSRKPPFSGNGATLHQRRLSRVSQPLTCSHHPHSSHASASSRTSSRTTRPVLRHSTRIPSTICGLRRSSRASHQAAHVPRRRMPGDSVRAR